jgi:hypothetical protein
MLAERGSPLSSPISPTMPRRRWRIICALAPSPTITSTTPSSIR